MFEDRATFQCTNSRRSQIPTTLLDNPRQQVFLSFGKKGRKILQLKFSMPN